MPQQVTVTDLVPLAFPKLLPAQPAQQQQAQGQCQQPPGPEKMEIMKIHGVLFPSTKK